MTGTFSSRADVARMRLTWLSSPDQGGGYILLLADLLCVALRSHVRPLTHITPLDHTYHTPHIHHTGTFLSRVDVARMI